MAALRLTYATLCQLRSGCLTMWYLSATESGIRAYPESLHKYLYADSDPTNSYDPTGHEAFFEMAIRFAKVAFNVYNQISPALTGKSFGDCVKTAFNAEISDMNAALEGESLPVSGQQITDSLVQCEEKTILGIIEGPWSIFN